MYYVMLPCNPRSWAHTRPFPNPLPSILAVEIEMKLDRQLDRQTPTPTLLSKRPNTPSFAYFACLPLPSRPCRPPACRTHRAHSATARQGPHRSSWSTSRRCTPSKPRPLPRAAVKRRVASQRPSVRYPSLPYH